MERMIEWEYRYVTKHIDESSAQRLGEDGWEMCGTTLDETGREVLMFKRPKRRVIKEVLHD